MRGEPRGQVVDGLLLVLGDLLVPGRVGQYALAVLVTDGIGGGRNAGLLAVRILAAGDPALLAEVESFRADLAASVEARDLTLQERLASER